LEVGLVYPFTYKSRKDCVSNLTHGIAAEALN